MASTRLNVGQLAAAPGLMEALRWLLQHGGDPIGESSKVDPPAAAGWETPGLASSRTDSHRVDP
jgi:hypothetical protein